MDPVLTEVLQTEVTTIIVNAIVTILGLAFTAAGAAMTKWLHTSSIAKKYKLNNEKVENIIKNAVNYAEEMSIKAIKNKTSITSDEKKAVAIEYVKSNLDTETSKIVGNNLEQMLDRAVYVVKYDKRNKQK